MPSTACVFDASLVETVGIPLDVNKSCLSCLHCAMCFGTFGHLSRIDGMLTFFELDLKWCNDFHCPYSSIA